MELSASRSEICKKGFFGYFWIILDFFWFFWIPGAHGTVGIFGIAPPPSRGHAWAEIDLLFLVDSRRARDRGYSFNWLYKDGGLMGN